MENVTEIQNREALALSERLDAVWEDASGPVVAMVAMAYSVCSLIVRSEHLQAEGTDAFEGILSVVRRFYPDIRRAQLGDAPGAWD